MAISEHTPTDLLGVLNEVERKNAPARLYTEGDISLLRRGPRVSVVGSRKASDEGLRRARILTKALVQHSAVVISGLAEGIDTMAHQTAIASGGQTVAVLGTPLDKFFPAKNRELQERIRREFLLVSQFPIGGATSRKSFPMRNRTMALLSSATIIVEAGDNSGSLHQGWEALRLGRLLFIMDAVVQNPALSWPAEMMHYGAQVLSRENLEDVLAHMPAISVDEEVTV